MSKSYLVIPDAHATPFHHNERFDLLGEFIIDRKPDVIINIGDFADMPSLCSYDKGKKSFEGRRYKDDIKATVDAQERMFKPMSEYNERQRRNSKKQYKPELILTLGNHEHRINRVTESQAELDGAISVDDLQYKDFGWDVYNYGTPVIRDGVAFCHNFTSGVLGKPISGEHPAFSMVSKMYMSCVAGHSHTRDFCERTATDGKRLLGIVVGCYLDMDQHERYAGEANKMWWKGLVMLNDVDNGEFEPEFINMKQLRRAYA